MKYFKLIFILLFLINTNCDFNKKSDYHKAKKQNIPKKLTQFIDSLKNNKIILVDLNIPEIGYTTYGESTFIINFKVEQPGYNCKDSLKKLNERIASELYSRISEDTTLFDVKEIITETNTSKINLKNEFSKKQLEFLTGIKVIKLDENHYKKIYF